MLLGLVGRVEGLREVGGHTVDEEDDGFGLGAVLGLRDVGVQAGDVGFSALRPAGLDFA